MKKFVPLVEFAKTDECPFTARALRERVYRAKSLKDTKGKARQDPSDEILLSTVIQPSPKAPWMIDTARFAMWMDSKRLTTNDHQ